MRLVFFLDPSSFNKGSVSHIERWLASKWKIGGHAGGGALLYDSSLLEVENEYVNGKNN